MRTGVGVQALGAQDLGDLGQGFLVIGFELEDFLEDRARFRGRAFSAEMLGDLEELLNRLVGLACAGVQVAERVLGVPVAGRVVDDAYVFRDAVGELPLPNQLFSVAKRQCAIECHFRCQSIVSNSVGGRNERR